MAEYVNSEYIQVFPSTRRSSYQSSSRYMLESSFSNIAVNVCDANEGSYILTKPKTIRIEGQDPVLQYDEYEKFEIMIHGYHFTIDPLYTLLDLFPESESILNIYCYITLDTSNEVVELKGRDEEQTEGGSIYTGLKFVSDPTSIPENAYKLQLFHRDNSSTNWVRAVYQNSLSKVSNTSFICDIDGGIIR